MDGLLYCRHWAGKEELPKLSNWHRLNLPPWPSFAFLLPVEELLAMIYVVN